MASVLERRLTLGGDPASVSLARRSVDELLADAETESDVHDRAVLCTSELVANAIEHGEAPVDLHVMLGSSTLRIEVSDQSGTLPTPGLPSATDTRGRGLLIVRRLTDRWGFEPLPTGKTVWCELAVAD